MSEIEDYVSDRIAHHRAALQVAEDNNYGTLMSIHNATAHELVIMRQWLRKRQQEESLAALPLETAGRPN